MHPNGNRLGNDTAVKKVLRYFSLSVRFLLFAGKQEEKVRHNEHFFIFKVEAELS